MSSNYPPIDANPIRDRLIETYPDLLQRAEDLIAAAGRVPVIDDDEIAGRVGDFSKQVQAHVKLIETTRVNEKEPYLAGSRAIDGYFTPVKDRLEKALAPVRQNMTSYLRMKESAERQKREAEARAKREEADRLAKEAMEREAETRRSTELMQQAAEAETVAATIEQRVEAATPADLARTRGDHGSVSTLQRFWTFRDLDRAELDLNALRHHLPADALEKAVRSFIKAGGRELRGVEIYQKEEASFR